MDIEDSHQFIHSHRHLRLRKSFFDFQEKFPNIEELLSKLVSRVERCTDINKKEFQKLKCQLEGEYKYDRIKNTILIYLIKKFYYQNKISKTTYTILLEFLQTKSCRSYSGILEVAIMTSPWNMAGTNNGCDHNCYFCPDQKGFPRSYIKEEPAVRRAQQFKFDPVKQIYDRLSSYMCNGHEIDKLEIIVLGGTWSSYEYEYQQEFIRDVYYGANSFYGNNRREKKTLLEEMEINMTSMCKIIGLTIETRPDSITEKEILRFNALSVTRVQLGVQTTNDYILKKINRGCYNKDTIQAIRLLKESGFKILIHLMPNLPFSKPEIDIQTMDDILYNPDYQVDELKIYPTSVTTTSSKDTEEVSTVIEKWFRSGKYVPYSNIELFRVIKYLKTQIPIYMRISRIFRDIPVGNITGGADIPNMRQVIQKEMEIENKFCKCIRCREIKDRNFKMNEIYYQVTSYDSSNGIEYFISANVNPCHKNPYQSTLIGFLRLRVPLGNSSNKHYIPVLQKSSLVRELHVYGRMKTTHSGKEGGTQHRGIGKKMLRMAEKITLENNLTKIAVISGVGVRKYYEKKDYRLINGYMSKSLYTQSSIFINIFMLVLVLYLYLYLINLK